MKWSRLECHPEIFTDYALQLGLIKGYGFNDLLSLEYNDLLSWEGGIELVNRCEAILVVASKALLQSYAINHFPLHCSNHPHSPIFIRQTIDNSCGTIALLHTLINLDIITDNPLLSSTLNKTHVNISHLLAIPDNIDGSWERARWMERQTNIQKLHEYYAKAMRNKTQEEDNDDYNTDDLHYVAIVKNTQSSNEAIWLDGRLDGPLMIDLQGQNFLSVVLKHLQAISKLNSNECEISALLLQTF